MGNSTAVIALQSKCDATSVQQNVLFSCVVKKAAQCGIKVHCGYFAMYIKAGASHKTANTYATVRKQTLNK